jgi:hypothetical protein
MIIMCAHCEEKPATCIGAYEGDQIERGACDDCCGHACEDGHCHPIFDDPETYATELDQRGVA